jgi:hypothetical protein
VARIKHESKRRTLLPMQQWELKEALRFGPWRLTDQDGNPAGPRQFPDDELRFAWQWAKFEERSHNFVDWGEEDWGWRVFELGEGPVEAFRVCRRLQRERREAAWRERGISFPKA